MLVDPLTFASLSSCRSRGNPLVWQATWCLFIGAYSMLWMPRFHPVSAADLLPTRGHILLPPTRGATDLSTYIDAQARYVAAVGDYAESVAIARRHHAEAFSREMDNSLKWVETYFERRALNNAYRLRENPIYLDRLASREKAKERLIYDFPAEIQKGEPSVKLNWLLNEIANHSLAYSAVYGSEDGLLDSVTDLRLLPGDTKHIWLTEANVRHGQKLVFRASDATVLHEDWPLVFRDPEFEPARKAFFDARTKCLDELSDRSEISWETFSEMRQAVDGLWHQLELEFPKERRLAMSGQDYTVFYNTGRRFIDSLAASVMRLAATNRMETFDGSNRFEGETVFDLVRHLCHRGLVFAPPKPGDEPTYTKLLAAMRYIWLELKPPDSP